MEEVPTVHPRFSLDFIAGQLSCVQQRTGHVARQSLKVGFPADLRRCRPAHELSRYVEAGPAPVRRRRSRGNLDCVPYSRFGGWSESDLGLMTTELENRSDGGFDNQD